MSAELRERLYVFYERFNPENAVRVDEIARTYAGREVELWTELSRKYGPEAVELAAAEHQRRRNARYAPQPQPRAPRYDPPPQQPQYRVVPPRYDDRMPPPRYDDRGPPQRPPQQRMAPMMGGFSNTAPPQQHEPPAAYASRYAPKQQQPPQQRFGGGAARVLSPPPRSKDEARPFQPRVQRPIPPAFDAAPRTGGFDLKSAKPAKPAKPAKQPKKPPAQQPPAQPPQHVSPQPLPLSMPPGAAAAPAGNDPVSLNADVLAEISATLALPGAFTSDEELHERQQGTATHAAVCARRALERLSKAGRDRVRQGGGLLAVLGACEPWYRNAGPAGKRTASETFVLVDRRLLKALRVSLGTLLDFETCRDAAVNEVAHALQRTEAWRAALADADRARDAVQHAEEESLRTIAKVMREDTVKAVDLLYDRLSDANRVASALEAPAVFAYAGAKVATTLFNTMQVCNPESIAREDRGNVTSRKLEAHERAPTLDKLRRLIVAALQLQAITPRQRARRRRPCFPDTWARAEPRTTRVL